MQSAVAPRSIELSAQQLQHVAEMRVFFGHQSVGDNVIQGLRDLMAEDSRLHLNIVHSSTVSTAGPAFAEFYIGQNRDPGSKDAAFAAAIENGIGETGGVALYKYCYIDVGSSTDVVAMFRHYQQTVESLKKKYPKLTFVHATVPLTTVDGGLKSAIKLALGRNTDVNVNAKRNEFNDLLRETYGKRDIIFDLAEVESTHLDGSRCYVTQNGRKIYALAPELTTDGGHLNEAGRRAAAQRLLAALAAL